MKIRKKLIAMILTIGLVWANKKFNIGISPEDVKIIAGIAVTYIAGQAVADIGKSKQEEKTRVAKIAGHIPQDIRQ